MLIAWRSHKAEQLRARQEKSLNSAVKGQRQSGSGFRSGGHAASLTFSLLRWVQEREGEKERERGER